MEGMEKEKEGQVGSKEEHHEIVVVGGGICGLATALALHRKGINSVVLEKSDSLRATGAAIGIFLNGWHALDQLGVGTQLREKAIPLTEIQEARLRKNKSRVTPCRKEALRCLKRSDLIESLAGNLPAESIRFGCEVVAFQSDPITSFPTLHLSNGTVIKAKVLIGCDGSNSTVAKILGLDTPRLLPISVVRGFTSYSDGHTFGSRFLRLRHDRVQLGRLPVDEKLVHWFVARIRAPKDQDVQNNPVLIKDSALEALRDFDEDMIEMVRNCDLGTLSLTHIRYRAPWRLLGRLQKGTATVAGDAMHVMGPFIGQGGSAGLEDAIVLARCLAQEKCVGLRSAVSDLEQRKRIEAALSKYVKERRLRVMRLSTQSYLVGSWNIASSWIKKLTCLAILVAVFGGMSLSHTRYDCGTL